MAVTQTHVTWATPTGAALPPAGGVTCIGCRP